MIAFMVVGLILSMNSATMYGLLRGVRLSPR